MAPALKICPVCEKSITRSTWSVNCYICGKWFHLKNCSKLSNVASELLTSKGSEVIWKCQDCSSFNLKTEKSDAIWDRINDVCSKLDDLTKSISAIVKKEIDSSIKSIRNVVEQQTKKCELFHSDLELKVIELEKERHKISYQMRRNDILVSGIPTTVVPLDIALKIPYVLGVDCDKQDVCSTFWLGKNRKTLLIKFCSSIKRDEIMKKYLSD